MKSIIKIFGLSVFFLTGIITIIYGQSLDWRNAKYGAPIYTNGYCDQPYVVVLGKRKMVMCFYN